CAHSSRAARAIRFRMPSLVPLLLQRSRVSLVDELIDGDLAPHHPLRAVPVDLPRHVAEIEAQLRIDIGNLAVELFRRRAEIFALDREDSRRGRSVRAQLLGTG